MRIIVLGLLLLAFGCSTKANEADLVSRPCVNDHHAGTDYVVCSFNASADIRLFLNDAQGAAYGHFNTVNDVLAEKDEKLIFAMNAGMYHKDRSPVGLYIEAGEEITKANDNDGPGNFHLKPNGVFWLWAEDGFQGAHVLDTSIYKKSAHDVITYATQSGPMLVIGGDIHPRFLSQSDSRKRRNGVGVTDDGGVVFVIADSPVNFYDFAMYFRDELKTPNALFLDGSISRLYAPELYRNDPGQAMGPIVGVVVTK